MSSTLFSFPRLRPAALALAASLSLGAAGVQAQDMGQLEQQMRKATEDARAKQQAGQRSYSVQSAGNLDADLNAFVSTVNSIISCASSKSNFSQQYSSQINQGRQMVSYAQQLLSNPTLKALASGPISSVLQSALPLARNLASQCQSYGGGQSAAASKYDQVSSVMKQVFSGGDLGPNSRAVKWDPLESTCRHASLSIL